MTTYTWNTNTSGNWSGSGNWTPSGPPISNIGTTSVVIGPPTATKVAFVVTEDATTSIYSLTINGYNNNDDTALLIVPSNTLTVGAGGVTLDTTHSGTGAVIEGTGTLIANGTIAGTGVGSGGGITAGNPATPPELLRSPARAARPA